MHCCCTDGDPAPPVVPAPSTVPWPRRIATLFQWALPVTTLVLIPKCPACMAAYVLLVTGAGISLPTASGMRWALMVPGIAALACLLRRAARPASTSGAPSWLRRR